MGSRDAGVPAKDWGYDLPHGSRRSIVAVQPRPIRETRQGNKRDAIRWSGGVRLRATLTPYPGTRSGAVGMAEVRAGRNGPWQCMRYRKARAMTIETRPEQNPRHPDAAYLPPRASGLFDPRASTMPAASASLPTSRARKSHQVIKDALAILENLEHRGAVGADPIAGDGAGILIQIPHDFLAEECASLGSSCRSPATTPSATCSCRRTSGCARTASAYGCASSARRAWSSSAGARCRSTTAACPRWSRRSSRCTGRSSSAGRRR